MIFPVEAVAPGRFSAWARAGGRAGAVSAGTLAPITPARPARRIPGLLGALTSTDHKRIGLNLGLASFLFFLGGGVMALLMRTQIAQPNLKFVSDDTYNQLFTMHGSTMIYLFVTPMAIAMALYLVPAADRRGRPVRREAGPGAGSGYG